MGRGFRTNGEKVGWKSDIQGREKAYAAIDWTTLPDRIIEAAERLRGVQIEQRPAIDVIARYNFPNVLIYADPPYMLETRHGKQYKEEMTDKDHEVLLTLLKLHKGPALISGYESDLYNEMLKDWHKEETFCYSQVGSRKKEILVGEEEPFTGMCGIKNEKWDEDGCVIAWKPLPEPYRAADDGKPDWKENMLNTFLAGH